MGSLRKDYLGKIRTKIACSHYPLSITESRNVFHFLKCRPKDACSKTLEHNLHNCMTLLYDTVQVGVN